MEQNFQNHFHCNFIVNNTEITCSMKVRSSTILILTFLSRRCMSINLYLIVQLSEELQQQHEYEQQQLRNELSEQHEEKMSTIRREMEDLNENEECQFMDSLNVSRCVAHPISNVSSKSSKWLFARM